MCAEKPAPNESLAVAMHTYLCQASALKQSLSLYKIVFHFKALLWESSILELPSPICKAYPIALLLHAQCAIIYAPPPTPPFYAIHHTILVMAISCKGQGEPGGSLRAVHLCVKPYINRIKRPSSQQGKLSASPPQSNLRLGAV